AVYDVFAGKQAERRDGAVEANLRSLPCRLFAVLPAPIEAVDLNAAEGVSAGQPLAWEVKVRAAGGRPLRTNVPVRVRLLDADGGVLEEHFTAAVDASAGGRLTVPLNAPEALLLEATELFGGKSARVRVKVTPAGGAVPFAGPQAAPPAAPVRP